VFAQAPSEDAMTNLVRLLVAQGTITPENGEALIAQAKGEAQQVKAAQAPAAAPQQQVAAVAVPAVPTWKDESGQAAVAPAASEVAMRDLPPPPSGTIRVPYIPETVRKQIRDEIKAEVMQQAAFEGWAAPDQQTPDWVRRITINGDIRFRSQSELFSDGNSDQFGSPTDVIDFARFNDNGPFDINGNTNPTDFPRINTRQDRWNRLRLRARLGVTANIAKGASAGLRIATGDDNGPISTNQILGGGFAKKDVWLDQAWVKLAPVNWANATFGRFANPFHSTELLYDSDVNFDGAAATFDAKPVLPEGTHAQLTLGAFPLSFGSSDFPVNQVTKAPSNSKWLFAAELSGGATVGGVKVDASAGYHSFKSVQGQLSAPCAPYLGNPDCSSDQTRPFFLRKGNTLFFLRDIIPPTTQMPLKQFVGLNFDYDILDVNASVTVPVGDHVVWLAGNYVRNLSFKRSDICRYGQQGAPLVNITASSTGSVNVCDGTANPASFNGGNEGYLAQALIGDRKPAKFGQWNVLFGYRYLQSDAVLDSLTDSDFHLGGTNSKGYFVGATVGLFDNVTIGGRWLSANEIAGPPLAIDVLQIDLSAAF
jgi:hypothetical protein